MDAARPRGRLSVERRRGLVVTVLLAAVADAVLWGVDADVFRELPAAYWLMATLALVVDVRPYVLADRRSSSVILPSVCFTFAIALAWGLVPALVVQLASVTVAGVRMGQPARRTLHLATQHLVALGVVALLASLVSLRIGHLYVAPSAL